MPRHGEPSQTNKEEYQWGRKPKYKYLLNPMSLQVGATKGAPRVHLGPHGVLGLPLGHSLGMMEGRSPCCTPNPINMNPAAPKKPTKGAQGFSKSQESYSELQKALDEGLVLRSYRSSHESFRWIP